MRAKLYESITGILMNKNKLHLLFNVFGYIEMVQVWSVSKFGVVVKTYLKRCEMSIFTCESRDPSAAAGKPKVSV